jgi:CheY-like chemotaxis protein
MSFRILVIDDDVFLAKIVALCLAPVGEFKIVPAFEGESGLRIAGEATPDLVVLDYDLPHQDGLEVLRAMRRQPALQPIPVVAVTGASADLPRCSQFVAESDAFLSKPLDFRLLRRTVLQMLRLPTTVAA